MARPQFKATDALKRKVSIAAGAGMSHEEIALGLGISRNTLEKHFAHELSAGAYERRLEVLSAMHQSAKRGNVAAQKAYMQLTPRVAVPPSSGDDVPVTDTTPSAPSAEQKPIGKKEQANADAKTAAVGTSWENLLKPPAGTQLN